MERLPEFVGNHLFLVTLFIAIAILLFWNIFGGVVSGVRPAPPSEVTAMLNRDGALIVDVREAAEFNGGHILAARNIPEIKLESESDGLLKFKDKPIVLCCANGTASARAARVLRLKGFEKLYSLKGGITAWRNEHLPLVRDADQAQTT